MSRCTDPEMGKLLHSFELNKLDDGQREAFELHALACDFCFEELAKFDGVSRLLRLDPDVRDVISTAAREAAKGGPFWAKLLDYLWPKTNFFLKPVVSYLLVLLLAYPAYVGIQRWRSHEVRGVQSLVLTGTRTTAGSTLKAEEPLVIMFRIDGAREGKHYRVTVGPVGGGLIYSNDFFRSFSDRELATLLLGEGSLSPGRYQIDIYEPDQDTPLRQYTFLVE